MKSRVNPPPKKTPARVLITPPPLPPVISTQTAHDKMREARSLMTNQNQDWKDKIADALHAIAQAIRDASELATRPQETPLASGPTTAPPPPPHPSQKPPSTGIKF